MLLFYDVQTTGLSPDYDEVIQISARPAFRNYKPFVKYAIPSVPIRPEATRVNGFQVYRGKLYQDGIPITQNVVKRSNLWERFYHYLSGFDEDGDVVLAGFNVNFDLNFTFPELSPHELGDIVTEIVDYFPYCRKLIPKRNIPNYKLHTVAEYLDVGTTKGRNDRRKDNALILKEIHHTLFKSGFGQIRAENYQDYLRRTGWY